MSKQRDRKWCRGFKRKSHETVHSNKLQDPFICVSLVHQTEATQKAGWNPALLDSALGIVPFSFIWGFLFFLQETGMTFPQLLPTSVQWSWLWANTSWACRAAFTSLLGTPLKFVRCCEWPLLFMAKNIHKQSLCLHKLSVCSIWGLASTLVTQRWHLSPFLMQWVILGGVSTHLYFPSVHNLDLILQCSTRP